MMDCVADVEGVILSKSVKNLAPTRSIYMLDEKVDPSNEQVTVVL